MIHEFKTSDAGIPNYIWVAMLDRYPQLRILQERPTYIDEGGVRRTWSSTQAKWTIHSPEILTETERTRRTSHSGGIGPDLVFICLVSADGYIVTDVDPYENLEIAVADYSRDVSVEKVEWAIFTTVQPGGKREVEVRQYRAQPGQLARWRTEARQAAANLFATDPADSPSS